MDVEYRVIDKEKYYRCGVFRHFTEDCKCSVSMTARVDVSGLVEHSRRTGTRFYINFLYVLSKVLNLRDDYRMGYLWQSEELICYDIINPIQYIFHEDTETCTPFYTTYYEDYEEFYRNAVKDEHKCKDREYVEKIERAILGADLLVFTSPAYVFHTTGAMKAMFDHFGYRWMPHRPAKEMFGKRAVIITQCLGAGDKSATKDIKDSLSWWGLSDIRVISFRLMSDIDWNRIPEKRRESFVKKLHKEADRAVNVDYGKPARTGLKVKIRFYMVRMMQRSIGKTSPDYTDYKYWKNKGWLDKKRPWKQG